MGKKNKIKDAEGVTDNLPIAEPLDTETPPLKKKSKKQSSTEIDSTVATNGSSSNGSGKVKEKKSEALSVEETPSLKKNSKKRSSTEIDSTIATNGSGKFKEKKSKALPVEEMESNAKDVKSKDKKKKRSKDTAAEEGEELISFKKPNKKRSADPENGDEEIPPKVSKANDNIIMAGTTMDQVVGIKLKNKKGKREKKREKHALKVEELKKKSKIKEREEMQQYLNCWSNNREKWKFLKLRQIYIQDNVFDENEINADLWPIALDYLSETKGSSRDVLVKKAESIIREGDEDETLQASSKYKRARELLQCFG
uniref:WKF domain-containing protein n=1 Tax=Anopheles minimus TaxID=112268 RepID=A0A182WJS8_9DIPT